MKHKLSTDSRRKGRSGELEFARLVLELTNGKIELTRNLEQVRTPGQSDLNGLEMFSIEVKRHKRFTDSDLNRYWIETVRQAGKLFPVLAYRQDMQQWKVMVHGNKYGFDICDMNGTIIISVPMFCKMAMEESNNVIY